MSDNNVLIFFSRKDAKSITADDSRFMFDDLRLTTHD
jgi:hypothetical protein